MPSSPLSTAPPHLHVIGSSTTLLFGPYLRQMLGGLYRYSRKGDDSIQLRQALDDLDVPQGASAGDSSQVLAYLRSLSPDFRPDIVLLQVGMHDLKKYTSTGSYQVPLAQYQANLKEIVAWFSQRPIRLIWLTGGPLDEDLHNQRQTAFHRYEADVTAYAEAARKILEPLGIEILDLAGFTRRLGPFSLILKDHIHLHDAYVRQQAAYLAGYLSRLHGQEI